MTAARYETDYAQARDLLRGPKEKLDPRSSTVRAVSTIGTSAYVRAIGRSR